MKYKGPSREYQPVEFNPSVGLTIMFALCESTKEYVEGGVAGHTQKVEDVPAPGQMFFIAASAEKMIYGPFRVTTEQYYLEEAKLFTRKQEGIPETYKAKCHWLFNFEPFVEIVKSAQTKDQRGIPWSEASKIARVMFKWREIRNDRLDDTQQCLLAEALLNLNRAEGTLPVIAMPFGSSVDWWEDGQDGELCGPDANDPYPDF